jgi:hypothetical protein
MNLRLSWQHWGTFLAIGLVAAAPALAGLASPFDTGWVLSGPGSVNDSAPGAFTLFGGPGGTTTDYTHTVGAGTWSFSWAFGTSDPGWQDAGYLVNGVYTELAGGSASGSTGPIATSAGDTIGFRINVDGGSFDDGDFTISDFSAATEAPEPSTLSLTLMAAGAGAVVVFKSRRKRQRA